MKAKLANSYIIRVDMKCSYVIKKLLNIYIIIIWQTFEWPKDHLWPWLLQCRILVKRLSDQTESWISEVEFFAWIIHYNSIQNGMKIVQTFVQGNSTQTYQMTCVISNRGHGGVLILRKVRKYYSKMWGTKILMTRVWGGNPTIDNPRKYVSLLTCFNTWHVYIKIQPETCYCKIWCLTWSQTWTNRLSKITRQYRNVQVWFYECVKLGFNCSINAQKSANCLPEKINYPKLDALPANILFISRF